MSLTTSQTITTDTLYKNVNAGDWRILAILGISAIGTVLSIVYRDGSQLIVIVSDLASVGASAILDGNLGVLKAYVRPGNTTALAADPALEVKLTALGSALITTTVPISAPTGILVNQNTPGVSPWLLRGIAGEGGAPVLSQQVPVLPAKDPGGLLQFVPLATGFDFALDLPVVIDKTQTGTLPVSLATMPNTPAIQPINGALKTLTPTANHLTANGTTNVTAADAWISSVIITVDAAGTTSTITIQDKSATPKKLVNAAITTAISTTPTVLSLPQPALMSGGIDIVAAGAVAATTDIWVDYWQ